MAHPEEDDQQPIETGDRGVPGEGAGRRDEIGGRSGVFPLSASDGASTDAPIVSEPAWGQGERGEEGYDDSGEGGMETAPLNDTPPDLRDDQAAP